jgi:hypothetical protein
MSYQRKPILRCLYDFLSFWTDERELKHHSKARIHRSGNHIFGVNKETREGRDSIFAITTVTSKKTSRPVPPFPQPWPTALVPRRNNRWPRCRLRFPLARLRQASLSLDAFNSLKLRQSSMHHTHGNSSLTNR